MGVMYDMGPYGSAEPLMRIGQAIDRLVKCGGYFRDAVFHDEVQQLFFTGNVIVERGNLKADRVGDTPDIGRRVAERGKAAGSFLLDFLKLIPMGRRGLSAYSPRRSDGRLLSGTRLPPGLHRCLRAAIGSGAAAAPARLPGGGGGGAPGRGP